MTRKRAILKAATLLFATKGYNDTSMNEVALMTGSASATIFYHFKNKEELYLAVLENVKDRILGDFSAYFSRKHFKTGLEMVEGIIDFYLYMAGILEDGFRLLHHYYTYRLAQENPVCRRHLEAVYDVLVSLFEEAIRKGQRDGSIVEIPPRKGALIVLSTVDSVVRFNTYNLFDAGALYDELSRSCRRMLESR